VCGGFSFQNLSFLKNITTPYSKFVTKRNKWPKTSCKFRRSPGAFWISRTYVDCDVHQQTLDVIHLPLTAAVDWLTFGTSWGDWDSTKHFQLEKRQSVVHYLKEGDHYRRMAPLMFFPLGLLQIGIGDDWFGCFPIQQIQLSENFKVSQSQSAFHKPCFGKYKPCVLKGQVNTLGHIVQNTEFCHSYFDNKNFNISLTSSNHSILCAIKLLLAKTKLWELNFIVMWGVLFQENLTSKYSYCEVLSGVYKYVFLRARDLKKQTDIINRLRSPAIFNHSFVIHVWLAKKEGMYDSSCFCVWKRRACVIWKLFEV